MVTEEGNLGCLTPPRALHRTGPSVLGRDGYKKGRDRSLESSWSGLGCMVQHLEGSVATWRSASARFMLGEGPRPAWASRRKAVDCTRPAPIDFAPLKGGTMVSRKSPQGTCSPSTFAGEGTQGPSADRGSHFAQCLLPECKQSGPSESSSIETGWAAEGVGERAACGYGLRVRSGHKALQEREDGCTRVMPGGRCLWGEHEVCVSHLVGLNGGREEAPEGGEKVLGPLFQQQGDLGQDRASEPSMDPSTLAACLGLAAPRMSGPLTLVLQVGGWWVQGHRPSPHPCGAAPTIAAGPH